MPHRRRAHDLPLHPRKSRTDPWDTAELAGGPTHGHISLSHNN